MVQEIMEISLLSSFFFTIQLSLNYSSVFLDHEQFLLRRLIFLYIWYLEKPNTDPFSLCKLCGKVVSSLTQSNPPSYESHVANLYPSLSSAILLGSRGVDLPHISNRLETLTTARTLQPLEALADTDIAAFLRNERENAIITAIEDSKRRVSIKTCYY